MATEEDCRIISEALEVLCEPLHRAGQRAWDLADATYTDFGMPETEYRGGRAHLGRHLLKRELRRESDLGDWAVDRRSRQNGAILMHRGPMQLKLLRPGPTSENVPYPGPNKARMYYYRNPKLNLFGANGSNLIGVWSLDEEDQFSVRLVRTVGTWKAFDTECIDIDLILPRAGEGLSDVEFIPSDEGLSLPFELEDGDEEGEAGDAE